ncbi:MAG: hypothetical protein WA192_04695 [Candidatus Acidiferrales bacterium]
MRDVLFKPRVGAVENAYRDLPAILVLFREASLPDVCIVCGTPAGGNLYRAEFEPYRYPAWHVPVFYDVPYWSFGHRYFVDFPFCAICKREDFDIQAARISEKVGFFSGVSNTFLKLVPAIPLKLAAELEGNWAQRALRFLMR